MFMDLDLVSYKYIKDSTNIVTLYDRTCQSPVKLTLHMINNAKELKKGLPDEVICCKKGGTGESITYENYDT